MEHEQRIEDLEAEYTDLKKRFQIAQYALSDLATWGVQKFGMEQRAEEALEMQFFAEGTLQKIEDAQRSFPTA